MHRIPGAFAKTRCIVPRARIVRSIRVPLRDAPRSSRRGARNATPVADTTQWSFPSSLQPKPAELAFDLNAALDCVVTVHAEIPDDAFTASILGTERIGNGVVIREDGLILTIGYLITEAQSIWITTNDGRV